MSARAVSNGPNLVCDFVFFVNRTRPISSGPSEKPQVETESSGPRMSFGQKEITRATCVAKEGIFK